MSNTTRQPEHVGPPDENRHDDDPWPGVFKRLWSLVPENLRDTFMPEEIHLRQIPGEETQIEIRLAWYRDIFGHIVFQHFSLLSGITILIMIVIAVLATWQGFPYSYVAIPPLLLLAFAIFGAVERFDYYQWRLLKTNARLVISIPQQGAWPLVDNIELKGAPAILDTNWSPNPMWRIFQFFTGARDLYISMSGLQFVEGRAKVRDALIIPDIMPEDVFELKKLVFTPR